MIIELSDIFIHLNRLGLLIVCLAIWLLVPGLLPPDKRAFWRISWSAGFSQIVQLFMSLLFVGTVFYYTVILFFACIFTFQRIASYVSIPGHLNFMVIIVALPIASVLQVYTMREMSNAGLYSTETPDRDSETSVSTLRGGTVLFSAGVLFQFLATFG